MSNSRYDEHARFLSTLSNTKRFAIIRLLLGKRGLNVTQIVEFTGFDQSTVSHCLKRLASCQYVFSKPNGKERIYSLNKDTIVPLLRLIGRHVKKYCPKCSEVKV